MNTNLTNTFITIVARPRSEFIVDTYTHTYTHTYTQPHIKPELPTYTLGLSMYHTSLWRLLN